jgi:hypothetical protein
MGYTMSDKRQFFRIQQDVIFSFKAVAAASIDKMHAEQHFAISSSYGLFAQFQQLDNDSNSIMQNIRRDNPDVSQFLDILNKKINLLSQQIMAKEVISVDDQDTGRIDLSQGGIAFTSKDPLGIESWIAIKLVFLPTFTAIVNYAQITRNQKIEDGSYLIGARFHQLSDEEERIIAKQVIETQIIQKQQSKGSKDNLHH